MYKFKKDYNELYRLINNLHTVHARVEVDGEMHLSEIFIDPEDDCSIAIKTGKDIIHWGVKDESNFSILCNKKKLDYVSPISSETYEVEEMTLMQFCIDKTFKKKKK